LPALKAASCCGVRPVSGVPALSLPARGPGSRAFDVRTVNVLDAVLSAPENAATVSRTALAVSAALPLALLLEFALVAGESVLVGAGVSESEPPLQASNPAAAVNAKNRGLMAPPVKRVRRRERTLRISPASAQSHAFVSVAYGRVKFDIEPLQNEIKLTLDLCKAPPIEV
jgi:hypothetical protein